DVSSELLLKVDRNDYAKPILYTISDLLCVNSRTLVSHASVEEFVPCWLVSKHSSAASPGKIAVSDKGLYLSNRGTCLQESLLLPWSCILRWQNQCINYKFGIFRVYVAGLVHPSVPNDLEALLAAHREHSFQVDGFSRDTSLDICCLIIVVDNGGHNNSLSTAFQKFAWCNRKERALPRSPDEVTYSRPTTPFLLSPYMQMHRPMLVEADVWPEPKMCSMSITWGIVSEVDLRSEFLRWIGSIRFVLMFTYLLMRLKKYRCTLSFIPTECDESVWRKLKETFGQDLHLGSFSGKNARKKGIRDGGKNHGASHKTTKNKRILPSLNDSIPEDWVSITSSFIGINVIHISHLATDGVYFADKTLGSDYIILHLMPSNMSRSELIRLMRTSYNGHSSECSKTGIALYVKAFRISVDAATSQLPFMWSADGEPFEGIATLQAERLDNLAAPTNQPKFSLVGFFASSSLENICPARLVPWRLTLNDLSLECQQPVKHAWSAALLQSAEAGKTDASDEAVVGVLSQRDKEDREHLIGYTIIRLNKKMRQKTGTE
ncbi:unnamed protein product, partial [Taenia asiatica]|uniref:DRMBL domain-containing protein n=1 Tax=Taenia asiatica TaxID=60517 RepID=A0A0R3VVB1_TAEAS